MLGREENAKIFNSNNPGNGRQGGGGKRKRSEPFAYKIGCGNQICGGQAIK